MRYFLLEVLDSRSYSEREYYDSVFLAGYEERFDTLAWTKVNTPICHYPVRL
jgi:hypothetical protein